MDLDLRSGDANWTVSDFSPGNLVTLYSETLDCELTVKVTHPEAGNLGGNLAETPVTPHLEEGDHIHFDPENVLEVRNGR